MYTKKRIRKKPARLTAIECKKHDWSHWDFVDSRKAKKIGIKKLALVKICKNCPKVMDVAQFMERKREMNLITEKAKLHIDLFGGF